MANMVSASRRTITITPDLTDIAGLSAAAACVVSWTAHGLSTGDRVSFQGIGQADWLNLNNKSYPITWLTANTFSIPFDSHTYGAYVAATDPGLIGTDFDIARMQSGRLSVGTVVGAFTVGETVTQATSGATGIVFAWKADRTILSLVSVVGTFDATHTVTGGTSGATAIPSIVEYAFPNGIRLASIGFKGATGDHLVVRNDRSAGNRVFDLMDQYGSGIIENVGGDPLRMKPYIMASDCGFADITKAFITLGLA
jgi:hypothetical protein